MQIKKVAVLTLVLAFVAGFFAPAAKANSIQKELAKRGIHSDDRAVAKTVYTNGLLDYRLGAEWDIALSEKAIKQLTQEMIAKYQNYNAYYNAVVVYAMPSEFTDIEALYHHPANALANVKKYAAKVLSINPKAFGIYYLRGLVTLRVAGFYEVPFRITPLKTFVKKHTNEARAALKDFEKVSKLRPDAAPWLDMADLYEGFGNKEKAQYCRKMDKEIQNARVIKKQQELKNWFTEQIKKLTNTHQGKPTHKGR